MTTPYVPVKSPLKAKKYYIVTASGKKVYFGATGYQDFTMHKDTLRRDRYLMRHAAHENWTKSGIDTPGFWSRWLLWNKPTIAASYAYIKSTFLDGSVKNEILV